MDILFIVCILLPLIILCWDHQPTPIKVINEVEYTHTLVCTIQIIKKPFLYQRKIFIIKASKQIVIPSRRSIFEPIISTQEIEKAYLIWKYQNANSN